MLPFNVFCSFFIPISIKNSIIITPLKGLYIPLYPRVLYARKGLKHPVKLKTSQYYRYSTKQIINGPK